MQTEQNRRRPAVRSLRLYPRSVVSFSVLSSVLSVVLLACVGLAGKARAETGHWLLIDTLSGTLTVMGEQGPLKSFANIAVGTRGTGLKQRRGDEVTPLGSFRVGWINRHSRFRLFFGLDYPNLEHASLALYDGRIDEDTFARIRDALAKGESPPQNTVLGGQIGIHGLGARDRFFHDNTDWTNGCIALTDEQIDELDDWIGVGTEVEIR